MLQAGSRAQGTLQNPHFNLLDSGLVQSSEAALALLNSDFDGPSRQAELAELLHKSIATEELVKKLEKITDPTSSLALEMCKVFRRGWQHESGMRLLQACHTMR